MCNTGHGKLRNGYSVNVLTLALVAAFVKSCDVFAYSSRTLRKKAYTCTGHQGAACQAPADAEEENRRPAHKTDHATQSRPRV